MKNNDVLRSIRYMVDLSEAEVVAITKLADPAFPLEAAEVQAFLKREEDEGYVECEDAMFARFLDGLIVHRRGAQPDRPLRPVEKHVTNNLVLKKLRVAFTLSDTDMHAILAAGGLPLNKPELSALFRQEDHRQFRPAGDQVLRNFLRGLTLRLRPPTQP